MEKRLAELVSYKVEENGVVLYAVKLTPRRSTLGVDSDEVLVRFEKNQYAKRVLTFYALTEQNTPIPLGQYTDMGLGQAFMEFGDYAYDSRKKVGFPLIPCVYWEHDVCGKFDYDGRAVSISSRYWPDKTAVSELVLNLNTPEEIHGFADHVVLTKKHFSAETEEDCKAQVTAWVQEEFTRLFDHLKKLYPALETPKYE